MKKRIATVFLAVLVSSFPVMGDEDFPVSVSLLQPGNFGPDVHMISKDIDTGTADERAGKYMFTGETMTYVVLARDSNGASDMAGAYGVADFGSGWTAYAICDVIPESPNFPGTSAEWGAYINLQTGLTWDEDTDTIYECVMTVPSSWTGEGTLSVEVSDQGGAKGYMPYGTETYKFNPPLSVSVGTSDDNPITFGDTDPATRTAESLNTIVIENIGIVELRTYIAGTDFSSSAGGAKCPTSNTLAIENFKYKATLGTIDSGWNVMPKYNTNAGCTEERCNADSDNGIPLDGPDGNRLSKDERIDVRLSITWPVPCIGAFDTGNIYAIVRAV